MAAVAKESRRFVRSVQSTLSVQLEKYIKSCNDRYLWVKLGEVSTSILETADTSRNVSKDSQQSEIYNWMRDAISLLIRALSVTVNMN
jgi:hypothetical protein